MTDYLFYDNMEAFDLKDSFRKLYPNIRRYTWMKKTLLKQVRLEFYLISNNLMPIREKSQLKIAIVQIKQF